MATEEVLPDTTEASDVEEVSTVRMVDNLWQVGKEHWQDIHDAVTEELLFFDGHHYDVETDRHQRDRYAVKVIGQESFNVIRHKSSQVTGTPRQMEARPLDQEEDPVLAEAATGLVEWEMNNPLKMLDDYLDIMVTGCLAARYWGIYIDFDPNIGEFGEITFGNVDPRNVVWEPGFHNPHDPACNWLIEDNRINVESAKELFPEHADAIVSDYDSRDSTDSNTVEFPTVDDGKVTIRRCWLKNDRTMKVDSKANSFVELPEDKRYMACPQCGWNSPPQGEIPEVDMPETGTCQQCGGPSRRVDGTIEDVSRRRFKDGKRLIITLPTIGVQEPVYDGPWPVVCRTFPRFFLTDYLHPSKPVGPSDISLNWSAQQMSDILMTTAGQRMLEFRNYYMMPEAGVADYKGDRFEFRDDQFNVMFYKGDMAPSAVQTLAGTSLDPAWNIYFQAVQVVLKSVQGISDLGLTPQQSKDIASSTVQQLTAMGEVPVEHLKRRYHRLLSLFAGTLWDFIRQTYTPARLARLRMSDGTDIVRSLKGDELPNFDFVLTDAAPLSALDKARAEATSILIQTAEQNPDWLDLIAWQNKMPASVLAAVKKKLAERAQRMAEQPQQPGMPPGQGGPQAPPGGSMGPPEQAGGPTGKPGNGQPSPPVGLQNGFPPSFASKMGVLGLNQ